MRIIEVRRFMHHFLVFINTQEDIKKIHNDKRFSLYADYSEKDKQWYGREYRFNNHIKTLQAAKKFVVKILKEDT